MTQVLIGQMWILQRLHERGKCLQQAPTPGLSKATCIRAPGTFPSLLPSFSRSLCTLSAVTKGGGGESETGQVDKWTGGHDDMHVSP